MYFCVVLCIVCFVTFSVLFVCICVPYYCHRVATQLQLRNISYHVWADGGIVSNKIALLSAAIKETPCTLSLSVIRL